MVRLLEPGEVGLSRASHERLQHVFVVIEQLNYQGRRPELEPDFEHFAPGQFSIGGIVSSQEPATSESKVEG